MEHPATPPAAPPPPAPGGVCPTCLHVSRDTDCCRHCGDRLLPTQRAAGPSAPPPTPIDLLLGPAFVRLVAPPPPAASRVDALSERAEIAALAATLGGAEPDEAAPADTAARAASGGSWNGADRRGGDRRDPTSAGRPPSIDRRGNGDRRRPATTPALRAVPGTAQAPSAVPGAAPAPPRAAPASRPLPGHAPAPTGSPSRPAGGPMGDDERHTLLTPGRLATVAAGVAVLACFGAGAAMTGGAGPGPSSGTAAAPPADAARHPATAVAGEQTGPVLPTARFQASGQGTSTTQAFRPTGAWQLDYQVTCPAPGVATAQFSVVHGAATVAGFDTSVQGTASGTRTGLPPEAVAVAVAVPDACTWTVTATVGGPGPGAQGTVAAGPAGAT